MRRVKVLVLTAGLAAGCGRSREAAEPLKEPPVPAAVENLAAPVEVAPHPGKAGNQPPGESDQPLHKPLPPGLRADRIGAGKPGPEVLPYGDVASMGGMLRTNQVQFHQKFMNKKVKVGGWVEKVLVEDGTAYVVLNGVGTPGVGGTLVACRMKTMNGLETIQVMDPLHITGFCDRTGDNLIYLRNAEVSWRKSDKE